MISGYILIVIWIFLYYILLYVKTNQTNQTNLFDLKITFMTNNKYFVVYID